MDLVFSLIGIGVFATVNILKGKYWMALFSGGFIGAIGAFRLPKPDSYWDTHWSSEKNQYLTLKAVRAAEVRPDVPPGSDVSSHDEAGHTHTRRPARSRGLRRRDGRNTGHPDHSTHTAEAVVQTGNIGQHGYDLSKAWSQNLVAWMTQDGGSSNIGTMLVTYDQYRVHALGMQYVNYLLIHHPNVTLARYTQTVAHIQLSLDKWYLAASTGSIGTASRIIMHATAQMHTASNLLASGNITR